MSAWRINRWTVALGIVGLILGIVLSMRWKAQAQNTVPVEAGVRSSAAASIKRLEEEQKSLRARLTELQKELELYQGIAVARNDSLAEIAQDLDNQRILAGLVPMKGPGVKVVLDDSTKSPAPGDDLSNYIVHEYQLRDVVNLLWEGGAEAMSLNNERIVGSTSIYCVGSTILVNNTRLSPPYEIAAIGNAASMENLLNRSTSLTKIKSLARQYGLQFRIQRAKEVTVVAYEGPLTVKYSTQNTVK